MRLQSLFKPTHFSWQESRFELAGVQGAKTGNRIGRGIVVRVRSLRLLKGRKAYEGCNTHLALCIEVNMVPLNPGGKVRE